LDVFRDDADVLEREEKAAVNVEDGQRRDAAPESLAVNRPDVVVAGRWCGATSDFMRTRAVPEPANNFETIAR
jgi:hypothetical protein